VPKQEKEMPEGEGGGKREENFAEESKLPIG